MKKTIIALAAFTGMLFTSCSNGSWEFPDNDRANVYFSYQSPIRTITLGEDITVDNSLDNEHMFKIMATVSGRYENNQDVTINYKIDNTLLDGLKNSEGYDLVAMPSDYYEIQNSNMVIPSGSIIGGVTVKLTDKYFADPKSPETHYVIPVVMTQVHGADSILCGKAMDGVTSPSLTRPDDWSVQPKNYTLYCVRYVSKYQANYLRRGKDVYTGARNETVARQYDDVEKSEVIQSKFSTLGINSVKWSHSLQDQDKQDVNFDLKLDFDANGKCTVSSLTAGVEASGSGEFISKGDKWGGKERDCIKLNYTVKYSGITCTTEDILVVRDRGVKQEFFTIQ